MKNTATLINVGRGALVDEEALAQALEQGEIAMAGLDVYRYEPLPADSPLIGMPNAVLTAPHRRRLEPPVGRGYSCVAGQNRRVFRCGKRKHAGGWMSEPPLKSSPMRISFLLIS